MGIMWNIRPNYSDLIVPDYRAKWDGRVTNPQRRIESQIEEWKSDSQLLQKPAPSMFKLPLPCMRLRGENSSLKKKVRFLERSVSAEKKEVTGLKAELSLTKTSVTQLSLTQSVTQPQFVIKIKSPLTLNCNKTGWSDDAGGFQWYAKSSEKLKVLGAKINIRFEKQ